MEEVLQVTAEVQGILFVWSSGGTSFLLGVLQFIRMLLKWILDMKCGSKKYTVNPAV